MVQYGSTALLWACLVGRFEVVKVLIEKGANIHDTDNVSLIPLL